MVSLGRVKPIMKTILDLNLWMIAPNLSQNSFNWKFFFTLGSYQQVSFCRWNCLYFSIRHILLFDVMGPFVMAKGMTDGGDDCWSQAFVPKADFGNTHEGSAFCALLQKVITSLVFTVNLKSPVLSIRSSFYYCPITNQYFNLVIVVRLCLFLLFFLFCYHQNKVYY